MGGGQRAPEVVLNVHQEAKDLQVAESEGMVRKYTLDGTPHTRPTDTGIQKAVDTAAVQGDNLVIETSQPVWRNAWECDAQSQSKYGLSRRTERP